MLSAIDLQLHYVVDHPKVGRYKKISVTLILLKIFDIYFCHYFAANKKVAITHLSHAMEPKTIHHLIVKDKVAEKHILGKYPNFSSYNGFTQQSEFQSSYCSVIQCATGLKLYYAIAYQKRDE